MHNSSEIVALVRATIEQSHAWEQLALDYDKACAEYTFWTYEHHPTFAELRKRRDALLEGQESSQDDREDVPSSQLE